MRTSTVESSLISEGSGVSQKAIRGLTFFNVGIVLFLQSFLLLSLALGLDIGGFSAADIVLYLLSWIWIFVPPFTVTTALIVGRRSNWRLARPLNLMVGALWVLTIVAMATISSMVMF